jgi:hypothetical protein
VFVGGASVGDGSVGGGTTVSVGGRDVGGWRVSVGGAGVSVGVTVGVSVGVSLIVGLAVTTMTKGVRVAIGETGVKVAGALAVGDGTMTARVERVSTRSRLTHCTK